MRQALSQVMIMGYRPGAPVVRRFLKGGEMAASKRLLPVLAALLLGVLVGSIAWTHAAGTATVSLSPGQASASIDKLLAAQTSGNVEAMTAMYTRDAVMWQDSSTYSGLAQIRKHNAEAGPNAYRVKRVSPVIVNGNLATTYERVRVGSGSMTMTWLGIGVYQLRGGHVAASWEFIVHGGPGSTPPFDKGIW